MVVVVNPAVRVVTTEDGEIIGYGQLVWAAGGHARRLSCSGHHLAGIHSVRSRADVDRMKVELAATTRVCVVGGRFRICQGQTGQAIRGADWGAAVDHRGHADGSAGPGRAGPPACGLLGASIDGGVHLTKPRFGSLLAAALVGMAVGSLLGSWCGDRFGRKPTLVASVLFFGVMTMVCAGANGSMIFVVLRFLSGIGFGTAFPIATTLMGEWMPPRAVGKAIGIMTLGIPMGIMLGALIASFTLPLLGWEWLFAGVGAVCLLFSAVLLRALPESPGFLLLQGRHREAHVNLSRAWNRPPKVPPERFI